MSPDLGLAIGVALAAAWIARRLWGRAASRASPSVARCALEGALILLAAVAVCAALTDAAHLAIGR